MRGAGGVGLVAWGGVAWGGKGAEWWMVGFASENCSHLLCPGE